MTVSTASVISLYAERSINSQSRYAIRRNYHSGIRLYIKIVPKSLEILSKCASFHTTGGWRNGSACLSYHF